MVAFDLFRVCVGFVDVVVSLLLLLFFIFIIIACLAFTATFFFCAASVCIDCIRLLMLLSMLCLS